MDLRSLSLATLALLASPHFASLDAAPTVLVQTEKRPTISHYNLEKSSLALSGYDPVSYFPEGGSKPKEGSKKIYTTHKGVTYRFKTKANKQTFDLAPERYEPAYGGWCAYAMSQGDKAEIDPKSFLIQEGRLLVFYNGFLSNTRKKWNKEGPTKLMPQADDVWKKLSTETRPRALEHHNLDAGLALAGYDPVAYMSDSPAAMKGKASMVLVHGGVTYHFANKENLATFKASPAKYEAGYGGWCAWAMAQGKKVAVDPTAYAVENGNLYLFYNADKRDEWLADKASFLGRSDQAWGKLIAAK